MAKQSDWWRTAVIYQIYPKSFNSTRGGLVGDIPGITAKLDYLKQLGIGAIWLTPVYKSPQVDNGYDISDYFAIHGEYGDMSDMEQLISEAHARDIRLIMDIVVNHTSTEHHWFQQALQGPDNPYHDFYIWRNGAPDQPPNNWESKFGGNAWQYVPALGKYYLHLFAVEQADLNWENPAVRAEVKKVIQFWADKGIDGFRLDVINLISKNQAFPSDDSGDGRRFYTDGPRVHEFLNEISEAVFIPNDVMTVGEMSSTTIEHCQQYSDPASNELSMVFNFHHLKVDYPGGDKWAEAPFDFLALKQILSEWQLGLAERGWGALFWCNHDQPRCVSRFGSDCQQYREISAKMLATAMHMLRGTPYIYQGEELGMTNPGFSEITRYRDIESRNIYQLKLDEGWPEDKIMRVIQARSRDNSRTPMQWDSSENAGFTSGKPWIEPAPNYKRINADVALSDPDSVFFHYQKLCQLRQQEPLVTNGRYRLLEPSDPRLFAYLREDESQALLVICNFYAAPAEFRLDSQEPWASAGVSCLLSNYPDTSCHIEDLELRPYEAAVFKLTTG